MSKPVHVLTIVGCACILMSGCGSSVGTKGNVDDATRVRHNENHLFIHQDADAGDPVVGWSTENGAPSSDGFTDHSRFLELTVLGNADHPRRCVLSIEELYSNEPDEDATAESYLLIGSKRDPKIVRSTEIPCSKDTGSTQLQWQDAAILMNGHLVDAYEQPSGDDDQNVETGERWSFHIDKIRMVPRIARFDPEGSFVWTSPSASPT